LFSFNNTLIKASVKLILEYRIQQLYKSAIKQFSGSSI